MEKFIYFIIYNHSDLRNSGGTRINSNSITIRLSYNFGHELYKEETTDGCSYLAYNNS